MNKVDVTEQVARVWVDDGLAGYLCPCGRPEILVVNYEEPTECACGRVYIIEQSTYIYELIENSACFHPIIAIATSDEEKPYCLMCAAEQERRGIK